MSELPSAAHEVLAFWFGEAAEDAAPRSQWFKKDAAFDATIRTRFGATIDAALTGTLAHWADTPAGAVALIVVLDQFTRNVFRDSAAAFEGDALALAAARALVAGGADEGLPPLQRWFAYMPFEHAEDRAAQRDALRLFKALADAHPQTQSAYDYALKHAAVIERFGRYPHRNAALGRTSTLDETAFLREPGSSF